MTVKKFLESVGASSMLQDPRLVVATAEIDGSPDRPRSQIQQDLARKEAARKQLARTHATAACPPEDILSAVYSLSDYNTYLLFNRDPVERMVEYLRKYFDPRRCEDPSDSLAISSGSLLSSSTEICAGDCLCFPCLGRCIERSLLCQAR